MTTHNPDSGNSAQPVDADDERTVVPGPEVYQESPKPVTPERLESTVVADKTPDSQHPPLYITGGKPFPGPFTTLKEYVDNSWPVEKLPELLWEYLQSKHPRHNIGPLNLPANAERAKNLKRRALSPEIEDTADRLREMLAGLVDRLKEIGIRRITFKRQDESKENGEEKNPSVKSGLVSYVIAHGAGTEKDGVKSGLLLRISSSEEEQHWYHDAHPPMLLKPIEIFQEKPVHIAAYPEIRTNGITRDHIAFLDMVSTISGYFFDDFQLHNAGFLAVKGPKNGKNKWLPIVLDPGAIADQGHELSVLKAYENENGKVFERCNWFEFNNRTIGAEGPWYPNYPKIPKLEGCEVTLDTHAHDIDVVVKPRTLSQDFSEWFETLKLSSEQIKDFDIKESKHYSFKREGEYFTLDGKPIDKMVEKHFGQMAIVAQAVNQKIHQLYRDHKPPSFPETWSDEEQSELKEYKMLRQQIAHEIRKVITPLYERAQDNYVRAMGMTPGTMGTAVTEKRLVARDEYVRKNANSTWRRAVTWLSGGHFNLLKKEKSEIATLFRKYPDADAPAVRLAMQAVIENEIDGPNQKKYGEVSWIKKVEQELKEQLEASRRL